MTTPLLHFDAHIQQQYATLMAALQVAAPSTQLAEATLNPVTPSREPGREHAIAALAEPVAAAIDATIQQRVTGGCTDFAGCTLERAGEASPPTHYITVEAEGARHWAVYEWQQIDECAGDPVSRAYTSCAVAAVTNRRDALRAALVRGYTVVVSIDRSPLDVLLMEQPIW